MVIQGTPIKPNRMAEEYATVFVEVCKESKIIFAKKPEDGVALIPRPFEMRGQRPDLALESGCEIHLSDHLSV